MRFGCLEGVVFTSTFFITEKPFRIASGSKIRYDSTGSTNEKCPLGVSNWYAHFINSLKGNVSVCRATVLLLSLFFNESTK